MVGSEWRRVQGDTASGAFLFWEWGSKFFQRDDDDKEVQLFGMVQNHEKAPLQLNEQKG